MQRSKLTKKMAMVAMFAAMSYVITIGLFILNILSLASNAYNPFIYFRF